MRLGKYQRELLLTHRWGSDTPITGQSYLSALDGLVGADLAYNFPLWPRVCLTQAGRVARNLLREIEKLHGRKVPR